MRIYEERIYGLREAVNAIGLSYNKEGVKEETIKKLIQSPPCSGHDSFLKGITINFKLDAPHYFIIEMQRYHFLDIVMSTSKMHSLQSKKFLMENLPPNINIMYKNMLLQMWYDWQNEAIPFEEFLAHLPLGFNLTMYIVTNYLQLKNIYYQRKHHRLQEWRYFCEWIAALPFFREYLAK